MVKRTLNAHLALHFEKNGAAEIAGSNPAGSTTMIESNSLTLTSRDRAIAQQQMTDLCRSVVRTCMLIAVGLLCLVAYFA